MIFHALYYGVLGIVASFFAFLPLEMNASSAFHNEDKMVWKDLGGNYPWE